ncbi:variable surface protein, partial [Plasmodium gonderi]
KYEKLKVRKGKMFFREYCVFCKDNNIYIDRLYVYTDKCMHLSLLARTLYKYIIAFLIILF